MHDSRKQFYYSLDTLLKKRNFDIAALRIEETHARQAYANKAKELEVLLENATDTENQIRAAQAGETMIIPERLNGMRLFLDYLRESVKQKSQELRQAEIIYQQIVDQIKTTKQSIKSLEKNKDRKKREHVVEQERMGFIEMDDLWLSKKLDSRT